MRQARPLHIHLHKFEDGGGISGVAVRRKATSPPHLQPVGRGLDVFMCGNAGPRKALDVFKRASSRAGRGRRAQERRDLSHTGVQGGAGSPALIVLNPASPGEGRKIQTTDEFFSGKP
jgi:S-adenosylmethionine/arginine decarboxylase-like enzyme